MGIRRHNQLPHYFNYREYESNLSEARIQMGLTIRELCEKAELSMGTYVDLNSGISAPIDRHGIIKPTAKRLADVLCMDLTDLWPRYFCDISKDVDLTPEQIVESFHRGLLSPEFEDPEYLFLVKERYAALDRILNKLKKYEYTVAILRFVEEYRQVTVAKMLGISKTRVGQIEKDIKRKLKYHFFRDIQLRYLCLDIEPKKTLASE